VNGDRRRATGRNLKKPRTVSAEKRPWTSKLTVAEDCTFHQIAPYIGRMKTSMARALVQRWTRVGDRIADPFCGSGVVALEAATQGRVVIAGDWNPYAALLTKAKLAPPKTLEAAKQRLKIVWDKSRSRLQEQDLRTVPSWVRSFFHPVTLRSALAFRDECANQKEPFLLACLLGILHHQRPGFLSFPSSHLVPYLRSRKFPRHLNPRMYEPRDVLPRLLAKLDRTYRRPPTLRKCAHRVLKTDARRFPIDQQLDAIITSPPYMNELDYVRDNRLRLWFIDRSLPEGLELRGRNRIEAFCSLLRSTCVRLAPKIRNNGHIVLVVGDATRGGGRRGRSGSITKRLFETDPDLASFKLIQMYRDRIPDIRRARRECRGTKSEDILIYRKNST
jgi:Putative RNA methylase family UPF0020